MKNPEESIDTSSETAVDMFACLTAIMMVLTTLFLQKKISFEENKQSTTIANEGSVVIFSFDNIEERKIFDKIHGKIKSLNKNEFHSSILLKFNQPISIQNISQLTGADSNGHDDIKNLIFSGFKTIIDSKSNTNKNTKDGINNLSKLKIQDYWYNSESEFTSINFFINSGTKENSTNLFKHGNIRCDSSYKCNVSRQLTSSSDNESLFYRHCQRIKQKTSKSFNPSRGSTPYQQIKTSDTISLSVFASCISSQSAELMPNGFGYRVTHLNSKSSYEVLSHHCIDISVDSIEVKENC